MNDEEILLKRKVKINNIKFEYIIFKNFEELQFNINLKDSNKIDMIINIRKEK